jgi:hypothetical protein
MFEIAWIDLRFLNENVRQLSYAQQPRGPELGKQKFYETEYLQFKKEKVL